MMKFIVLILSCCFSICSFGAISSPVTKILQEDKTENLPNPTDLSSGWWSYFEVDETKFPEHQTLFIQKLNNIKADLPTQEQEKLTPIIERIDQGLTIYLKLKSKSLIFTPIEKKTLPEYNMERFLTLGSNLFDLEKDSLLFKKQTELDEKSLSINQKNLDNKTLLYRTLPESSLEKTLKGFEIIENQVYLSIEKVRFNQLSFSLQQKLHELQQIMLEIDYARLHLALTEEKVPELEQKIVKENSELIKIQTTLENLQISLTQQNTANTTQDILIKQKIIYNNIKKTQVELDQIIDNITIVFLKLETLVLKSSVSQIYDQIDSWKASLTEITKSIDPWQETVRFDFEKALAEETKTGIISEGVSIAEKSLISLNDIDKKLFLANFLTNQLYLLLKERYTSIGDRIVTSYHDVMSFFKRNAAWFEEGLFKIGKTPVTPQHIIRFIVILVITYFVALWVRRLIKKLARSHKQISPATYYTIGRLVFYVINFLGIILAFIVLGVDLTAFAVIAGALSVGIGFGLQSIFSNFVAGLIVLLEKQIRVGDFIELDTKETGIVKEIHFRSTLIQTLDNLEILVPNSELISKKISNWTLSERVRRVHIPFSVAFGSDKDLVRKVIIEAAKKVPATIPEKKPDVWLSNFGENSLDFELVVWVNEYVDGLPHYPTKSLYLWAIDNALAENNIKVPIPSMEVLQVQK